MARHFAFFYYYVTRFRARVCVSLGRFIFTQEGDGVVINQPDQFAKAVLPKYYKHSNYQSFVRQVRARKKKSGSTYCMS